jgi:hypothetical protein
MIIDSNKHRRQARKPAQAPPTSGPRTTSHHKRTDSALEPGHRHVNTPSDDPMTSGERTSATRAILY